MAGPCPTPTAMQLNNYFDVRETYDTVARFNS
ncbi:hypothetical protein LAUMK35_05591 [Mycobacterium pseudokansasii]|uniref:Uncharacterized protein n=1 Tax=Mycobacterium pseudokansasii TaxID=2341080 RepID=A0A498R2X4_9MYCO|nr:hypothetical protein LAUMK35_05591 [Mycobacterium pseudokansasii]VBA35410.1 hypothetical protein LAUMK21_05551 [Mycobacterium pseudokansasii]VBA56472.1 hypothetical protein LAUMK142_05551 [Mycobacterium pseudokansasii]